MHFDLLDKPPTALKQKGQEHPTSSNSAHVRTLSRKRSVSPTTRIHLMGINTEKYCSISFWLELVHKSSGEPQRVKVVRTTGTPYSLHRAIYPWTVVIIYLWDIF